MSNPYARIPWNQLAAILAVQGLSVCHLEGQDFAIIDAKGRGLGELGILKWHQVDECFRKTASVHDGARALVKLALGEELAMELVPKLFPPPKSKEKTHRSVSPDTKALLDKVRAMRKAPAFSTRSFICVSRSRLLRSWKRMPGEAVLGVRTMSPSARIRTSRVPSRDSGL